MIVGPDPEEQENLEELLTLLYAPADIQCFVDPLMALKYGANNPVDALYTAVGMKRVSGFELGKLLRNFQKDIKLYLIANDDRERTDAMRIMADGYIVRPITAEKLRAAEQYDW